MHAWVLCCPCHTAHMASANQEPLYVSYKGSRQGDSFVERQNDSWLRVPWLLNWSSTGAGPGPNTVHRFSVLQCREVQSRRQCGVRRATGLRDRRTPCALWREEACTYSSGCSWHPIPQPTKRNRLLSPPTGSLYIHIKLRYLVAMGS